MLNFIGLALLLIKADSDSLDIRHIAAEKNPVLVKSFNCDID